MAGKYRFLAVVMASLLLCGPYVVHTTHAEETSTEKTEEPHKIEIKNPYDDKIRAKALKLSKNLDARQVQALANVRAGFGMVRAVNLIKGEVDNAVKECSKENPDMADDMESRFTSWKNNVVPAVESNEKKMEEAIKSGVFEKSEKDVRDYLDLVDQAADFSNDQIEKRVITTTKACEGLLKSMDKTEENIAGLLNEITWLEKLDEQMEAREKAIELDDNKED